MEKHQGTIMVRSRCETPEKNGSGTIFMLFFPDRGAGQPPAEANEAMGATAVSEQLA
jgi:hypothetical protein